MKILFVCGSIEAGRDGVGDYSRALCAALQRQGHSVAILAINDAFVSTPSHEDQESGNEKIKVFRLPHKFSWSLKETLAVTWIKEQRSDWASLQFVPFAFHPKGICLRLGGLLAEIKKIAQLHVMVHEPWLLWNSPLSWKLRGLGVLQKTIIRRFFINNRPEAMSTSLPLFQRALQGLADHVELSPIFGSIPVVDRKGSREWLLKAGAMDDAGEISILAGFFGQISPLLSLPLIADFIHGHTRAGKRVVIFHAGGLGAAGKSMWDNVAKTFGTSVRFVSLGRLSERDASLYFQALDYGLTSYSTVTWGKSGVVAAMREHGLTVIPCGDDALPAEKKWAQATLPSPWNVDLAATALLRQLREL